MSMPSNHERARLAILGGYSRVRRGNYLTADPVIVLRMEFRLQAEKVLTLAHQYRT